jgi:hypothetical protein
MTWLMVPTLRLAVVGERARTHVASRRRVIVQDLPEDNKTSGIVGMPYHVNNVDMTVASNFLFGTSQAVLEGLNGGSARDYFVSHADFQQVYENTAQLVSWAIETGAATARPDIALLYYPSLYDFLWMAARTARYLNTKGSEAVRSRPSYECESLCLT